MHFCSQWSDMKTSTHEWTQTYQHGRDQQFLVSDWGDQRREGESLYALLVLNTEKLKSQSQEEQPLTVELAYYVKV